MASKICGVCGKLFTNNNPNRTDCFVCKPIRGPSRAQLLAMAGLEDDGGCSVGGMAADLGISHVTININDTVRVVLTSEGRKRWCRYSGVETLGATLECSLWELMAAFGPGWNMVTPQLFVNNSIEIIKD